MLFPYNLDKNDEKFTSKHPFIIALTLLFGGDERIRTDDLLRAKQALSQLSYTPSNRAI